MADQGKITIKISEIIVRFLLNEISEAERQQLDEWLDESEQHHALFRQFQEEKPDKGRLRQYVGNQVDQAFQRFVARREQLENTARRRRVNILRYAALWLLPLLTGAALSWLYYSQPTELPVYAQCETPSYKNNCPILVLADGKELSIDKVLFETGEIPGVRQMDKDAMELIYTGASASDSHPEYHILRTPPQCDYHFILSDGTKVWVNAASSLKYPVAFGRGERVVYATGEIYLEVAKDTSRPFYVVTNDLKIEVLGTSFNINAYENEEYVAVTLVEGKVTAYTPTDRFDLLPDKQLFFDCQSGKGEVRQVDVQDFIAWIDGRYIFRGQRLSAVARVLERWYDLKIVFENKDCANDIYTGIVYKGEPVSAFIDRLNASFNYHCVFENNIIYIR